MKVVGLHQFPLCFCQQTSGACDAIVVAIGDSTGAWWRRLRALRAAARGLLEPAAREAPRSRRQAGSLPHLGGLPVPNLGRVTRPPGEE